MQLKVAVLVIFLQFIFPAQSGTVLESVELSEEDKKLVVDEHNKYRIEVSPEASDMKEMIWDPELAAFAVEYSRYCVFEHSTGGNTSNFSSLGENLYVTSQTGISNVIVIEVGIQMWNDEVVDYSYSENSCNAGKVCGHYTQVVWATSYAVGCGITSCTDVATFNQGTILVCNYGPPGNFVGRKPYTLGTPCSACLSGYTCSSNLCRDPSKISLYSSNLTFITSSTTSESDNTSKSGTTVESPTQSSNDSLRITTESESSITKATPSLVVFMVMLVFAICKHKN